MIINNEIEQYMIKTKESKDDLQQISTTVKESINEVREISYNLHPHQLERLGLTKAIESSINKVSHASNIKFELSVEKIDDLLQKKMRYIFLELFRKRLTIF